MRARSFICIHPFALLIITNEAYLLPNSRHTKKNQPNKSNNNITKRVNWTRKEWMNELQHIPAFSRLVSKYLCLCLPVHSLRSVPFFCICDCKRTLNIDFNFLSIHRCEFMRSVSSCYVLVSFFFTFTFIWFCWFSVIWSIDRFIILLFIRWKFYIRCMCALDMSLWYGATQKCGIIYKYALLENWFCCSDAYAYVM